MKLFEKYRKPLAAFLGLVAMSAYIFTIIGQPVVKEEAITVSSEMKDSVQIFLLDQDDDLIPFTVELKETMTMKQKLELALDYMIQGKQVISFTTGVFPSDTKVLDVDVSSNQVVLNLNQGFSKYNPKLEMRILEALAWVCTQFEGMTEVVLQMEGNLLTHMPRNGTPIPSKLNKEIGINNFEQSTTRLHNTISVTTFASKNVEDDLYYVPITKRLDQQNISLKDRITSILSDLSILNRLDAILFDRGIELVNEPYIQDNTLYLELNEKILDEEKVANEILLQSLLLSLKEIDRVEFVSIKVEGQLISYDGINDSPIAVQDMKFNCIDVKK